ncbi:MAG: chalcone isomerase family protein [Sideroxydans sp.]
MKRWIGLVCGLLLSLTVQAREVSDVQVAETARVGDAVLQLNGAGTRTRVIIDVYVAALYLTQKSASAEAVLNDTGPQRLALHMLYGMKSSKLLDAFKAAIEANHSPTELAALGAKLNQFYAIFESVSGVSPGDVILLDYLPGSGTRVLIKGVDKGVVEGADMHRALLKIWLGAHPVQDSLKKELLGFQ